MRKLWVSQTTGQRRTGTKVSDLRKLFEDGITAQAIYEPIQSCFSTDPATEIKNHLNKLYFDVAGIRNSEDNPVEGYIIASELTGGLCRDYKKAFNVSELITDTTPLTEVLNILKTNQRAFVLSRNSVEGIITRADLQKPPVRILLFGLISLLEMHLTYLVRKFYPNKSWIKKLKDTRIKKAKAMLKERKKRNEEIDLTDCLQFSDKRQLVLEEKNITNILGFTSKKSGYRILRSIEKLRDKLAHSQDIVTGSSWEDIISLINDIEKLIQKSEEAQLKN
jgi:hypothetical protein